MPSANWRVSLADGNTDVTSSGLDFRICVVCAGNICRSPIAESVLRRQIDDAGLGHVVTVDSAGTGGWHEGEPADHRALAVLARYGYDASAHRARQFRRGWFADVDLVIALDHDNFGELSKLAPDDTARAKIRIFRGYDPVAVAAGDTDVPDPYYSDDDAFQEVLDMVEKTSMWLVDTVRIELAQRLGESGGESGGEPSRR